MKSRHAQGERGYALIALLALMTLLMIAMMAAAPSLRQQARREAELEAIARGEEVADAIRMYISLHPAKQPPTSMDELLEGVSRGTRKVKVLRASASRDPLSESGEWRTVKLRDEALVRFIRDISEYAEGRTPTATTNPSLQPLAAQLPQLTGLVTGLGGSGIGDDGGSEDGSLSSSGPFIGVTSRSRRDSIITYYGIERHDRWVFTPFYR